MVTKYHLLSLKGVVRITFVNCVAFGRHYQFSQKNYDIISKGLLSEVLWKSKRVQMHLKSSQFLIFAN